MKEAHWKAASLALTTALIVVVASWATAQSGSAGAGERRGQVIVEASKRRYILTIGHRSAKEVDKYFIYDSWNLPETEEIWTLEDPHKAKSKWIRMTFRSKKKK